MTRAPKKKMNKKKSNILRDPKRKKTKHLPLDSSEDDRTVSDKPKDCDGDSIIMGTPPQPAKKKKLFPVCSDQTVVNLKDMMRNHSGGRKPWIKINAKKE